MMRLKYELGHSPVNIYLDRPNIYLKSLTEINCRLFLIGLYKGPVSKEYTRVEYITPDIRPNIVISQTKEENFEILRKFAYDSNCNFSHYEFFLPKDKMRRRELRAQTNIFAHSYLAEQWDFDEDEYELIRPCCVEKPKIKLNSEEVPYYISGGLPIAQMSWGLCPVVLKNPYTEGIVAGVNGFYYDNRGIDHMAAKLNAMDKEDIKVIGANAKVFAETHFPKKDFLDSWKTLIERII